MGLRRRKLHSYSRLIVVHMSKPVAELLIFVALSIGAHSRVGPYL